MTAPKHEHITEGLRRLAVPLGPLVLDPNNARNNDKRNIRAIKQSLSRFGQRKAIVVRKDGNIVTAGNGTVTAARQLGWKHIAAVVTNDTASSAAAYAIADNRTAELAEWDTEELAVILKDLQGDFDLPVAIEQDGDVLTLAGRGEFSPLVMTGVLDGSDSPFDLFAYVCRTGDLPQESGPGVGLQRVEPRFPFQS